MVGPLNRAPTIDPQPEPGGSQARGSHRPRCAPGPHAAGKGRPARGPHSTNIFPQGSGLGGQQLCPLTGAPPPGRLPGGFIVSGACLCMGGLLLTVCVPWIAPVGHGSHSPTVCTPPTGHAPQPGGPSRKNLEKTTIPPAGDAAGGTGPIEVCISGGGLAGRPPGYTVFGSVGCHPTRCVTSIYRIQHNFQLVKAQDFPFLEVRLGFL